MGEKLHGNVKWFNDAKGFGFITHQSGKDVFVHYSVICSEGFKTLKDGEEVEYELSEGDKGLHAKDVRRMNVPETEIQSTASSSVANVEVEKVTPKAEPETDVGTQIGAVPTTSLPRTENQA